MVTDYHVSSAADVLSALGSTVGGDRILVAPGEYGVFTAVYKTYSDYVTILPDGPSRSVLFAGPDGTTYGTIFGWCDHIRIEGCRFKTYGGTGYTETPALAFEQCSYIQVYDCETVSSVVGEITQFSDLANGSSGLRVWDCTNVLIDSCWIHRHRGGAFITSTGVQAPTNITVRKCLFEDINTMGLGGGNFVSSLIESNIIRKFWTDPEAGHPDAMHIWQSSGTSTGLTIRGNFIYLGQDGQSIFLEDNTAGPDGSFINLEVTDNVIYSTAVHGIWLEGGNNALIARNTVVGRPGTVAEIHTFNGDGGAASGVVAINNNITNAISTVTGTTTSGNVLLQKTTSGDPDYQGNALINAMIGSPYLPSDIRDFLPTLGGVADVPGLGASDWIRSHTSQKFLRHPLRRGIIKR